MGKPIVIMGVFMADATFRARRLPRMGETLRGDAFALGPGGKGSNQAVAAARAGGDVTFLTRLGDDTFADMAMDLWRDAGIRPEALRDGHSHTGAASILVSSKSGDNAIVISPGAGGEISGTDVDRWTPQIGAAAVFVTQLEQPIAAAERALGVARAAGTVTILNPAPAAALPGGLLANCDFITPNETEAEMLTGIAVDSLAGAEAAARHLCASGVGAVVITLGEMGALFYDGDKARHLPAVVAGPVVDTTGAGDAFNGGFATALAAGAALHDAVRFGVATAGVAVTRAGAASAMPLSDEIAALMAVS